MLREVRGVFELEFRSRLFDVNSIGGTIVRRAAAVESDIWLSDSRLRRAFFH
jgi:hypothetical protein